MKKKFKQYRTTEFYLLAFLVAILVFLFFAARGFYTMNNIMSVLNYFSYISIAGIGMNMIIITGNIDVSTGALISVVCICIAALGKIGIPLWGFLVVAMLVGAFLSMLNGLFITRLKIPAIVATLATTQIFQGALPLVVDGSIYDLPASYTWLAFEGKIFGVVPASVLFAVIIAAWALWFMKYSRFSKKIYAIGNSKESARLSGIRVDKTIVITYILAGLLFGVAAVIIGTAGQRVTTTMGSGLEMTFIAAVVLGGTSTDGGSGKILGSIIGAFILAIIAPAINYLGISPNWSDAVKGIIILVSVVVSAAKYIKKKRIIPDHSTTKLGGEAV